MAIAGLVLSIIGLASCFISWLYWLSFLALPISIAGLVLSCIARKKAADGFSTAGLVIGIIAVVLNGIFFFTCGLCTACACASIAY